MLGWSDLTCTKTDQTQSANLPKSPETSVEETTADDGKPESPSAEMQSRRRSLAPSLGKKICYVTQNNQ